MCCCLVGTKTCSPLWKRLDITGVDSVLGRPVVKRVRGADWVMVRGADSVRVAD